MSKELICNECGKKLNEETMFEFDETSLCEECFGNLTAMCDCCGDRIWRDHAEGDSFYFLCGHCYDYSYSHCERCGRLVFNEDLYYLSDEDDYGYCHDCYERILSSPIKNYGYKPDVVFYGKGDLFMGVEIEMDKGGLCEEKAKSLLNLVNEENMYFICKRDGSLEAGLEFVSMPMDLQTHTNIINYRGLFEKAISFGYRGHQCQTAGIHVHVNRSAFGKTYDEQEEVIARIVFFVENHWNELLKFSRRTEQAMSRWASRYGISENTQETYQKAKSKHLGRYTAVNIETYDYKTVEFRLFRSSLKYNTFLAILQLVDEICRVCLYMNDEELEGLSWSSFVLGIKENKPELIEYLKSKRLYVNDLIEEMEEI